MIEARFRMWFDGTDYWVKKWCLHLQIFDSWLLSNVFEKSLKIGRKNLWKSLDFFGLGDYEPWSNSKSVFLYRFWWTTNINKLSLVGMQLREKYKENFDVSRPSGVTSSMQTKGLRSKRRNSPSNESLYRVSQKKRYGNSTGCRAS